MMENIHSKFLEVSRKAWNKTMSIDAHTGTELTFGRGAIAARLLANLLKSKTDSRHVSILLPPCGGCLIAVFGTLFAGKVPVMINYSTGVSYNLDIAKRKCKTNLIITSRKFIDKLGIEASEGMLLMEDAVAEFTALDKIGAMLSTRFLPYSMLSDSANLGEKSSETSVILFTSGSEKEPKAVQLTHKNILSTIAAIHKTLELSKNEILLGSLPMFHSFGFMASLLFATNAFQSIFYPNPLDYKIIGSVAKEKGVTIMLGTPTFYEGYISKCPEDNFKSVKIAISGGDKLLEKTRLRFQDKFGVSILQGYGITECSAVASFNTPKDNRANSVGKPLHGTEVKIISPETGKEMPENQDGLILLKGDNITIGYLGDDEKTKDVIKDSWYHTGDIGRVDADGFLWFSGRVKRFVKIGGEMISLAVVEEAITKCIPENCECAVIGVSDEKRGARLHAFVTADKETISTLREEVRKLLPAIAVPKNFYEIDEIPKLGSGKPNFRELEKLVQKSSSAAV